MAQLSAGMVICWAPYDEDTPTTVPAVSSFTAFRHMKSIPDFNGSSSPVDVTTYENILNKAYIDGLKDTGELDFDAEFTNEFIAGVEEAIESQAENGGKVWISVQFPSPLMKRISYVGSVSSALPSSGEINGSIQSSLNTTVSSDIILESITELTPFIKTIV